MKKEKERYGCWIISSLITIRMLAGRGWSSNITRILEVPNAALTAQNNHSAI
jgi:hypothetical protein